MAETPSSRSPRPAAAFFLLAAAALFACFLAAFPVRFRTPEPLRLEYDALQCGLRFGPLSSDWRDFEWRKVFDWKAGDTEYRPRPVAQLLEVLTPRLDVRLMRRFGPFLWFPSDLLLTLLIAFLIAALSRSWTGRWEGGWSAAGFWLITTEVMVGHHAPVRPTKSLVSAEILLGLLLLLSLRGLSLRRAWPRAAAFLLVFLAGLFSDEYGALAAVLYAALILLEKRLRPLRWGLIGGLAAAGLLAAAVYLKVLPHVASPEARGPFVAWKIAEMAREFIPRNPVYGWRNSLHLLKCCLGWLGASGPGGKAVLIAAFVVLAGSVCSVRGWKGAGPPTALALLLVVLAGVVLLPAGTDILYQYTYYNRPPVALLLAALGVWLTPLFVSSRRLPARLALPCLLVFGLGNLRFSAWEVARNPENNLTRLGVDGILELRARLVSGELEPPVYLAYPRLPDPSRSAWDELEFKSDFDLGYLLPWPLHRYLLPILYLRFFEEGTILGDPDEFKPWRGTPEASYLGRARTYCDLVAGEARDLESFSAAVAASAAGRSPLWSGAGGSAAAARPGFWGFPAAVVLSPGSWRAEAVGVSAGRSPILAAALRCRGETRYRFSAASPGEWQSWDYGWSWKIVLSPPGASRLEIDGKGEAEVLGPVLLPAAALEEIPWISRPPPPFPSSGVRPLRFLMPAERRSGERRRAGIMRR